MLGHIVRPESAAARGKASHVAPSVHYRSWSPVAARGHAQLSPCITRVRLQVGACKQL